MVRLLETFLMAFASGLAGWLLATLKDKTAKAVEKEKAMEVDETAVREGVKALLHNCLFDYYEEYADKDAIPMSVWHEINRVYETYHTLGGNNTGTRIYDHLRTKRLLKDE